MICPPRCGARRRLVLSYGLLVAALLAAAPAAADDTPQPYPDTVPVTSDETPEAQPTSDDVQQLDTVTVSGDKLGRSLDESIASVRIIDGEAASAYGDDTAYDALRRIGNAAATESGNFSLRGINSFGVDGNEFARPTASVYVDGVALERVGLQSGAVEAFDVERIEVLRGVQSTSQGRGALAGGLVIRTRDPLPYPDVHGRLAGAELGRREAGIAGGAPITRSTAFRLVAHTREDAGDVVNATLNDPDWVFSDAQTLRAKLGWQPDGPDGNGVVVSVGRSETQRGAKDVFVAFSGQRPRTSRANTPSFYDTGADLISLDGQMALAPGWRISSVTGAQLGDEAFQIDNDYSDDARQITSAVSDTETLTQELRLAFDDWLGANGVFGIYAGRFAGDYVGDTQGLLFAVPGVPGEAEVDFDFAQISEQTNLAAFAEADWPLTDRMVLTTGLRYDYERSSLRFPFVLTRAEYTACASDVLPLPGGDVACTPGLNVLPVVRASGAFPESDGGEGTNTYDAVLPKAGVRYALTDALTVSGQFALGYRAGGQDVLFTTGETRRYEPETTRNYELGLRWRALRNRLAVDVNLFHIDWRDQQVQRRTESGDDSFITNAARSELTGGELDVRWRASNALQAYVSAGYTRTRFGEYTDNGVDFSGNEFGRSPRRTGSAGAAWNPTFFGLAGWSVTSSVNFTDGVFALPDNDPRSRTASRTTWDARIGYETRRWGVFAVGRNLLDRDFAVLRTYVPATPARDEEGQLITYGARRQIGLRLEGRF